jgi:putative aldouronate transport system substrate-binding protein
MNKKKTVKWTALGLAAVLALTGCASNTSKQPAASNVSATPVVSASTAESTKPLEEITLKIGGNAFGITFPSGIQDDPVAQEILRKTGVKLDVDSKFDEDKFKVQMASGDIPDILVTKKEFMKQLIEGNLVQPLDDLVQSNGKDILKEHDKMVDASKKFFSNGTNKLYYLIGLSGQSAANFKYESPGYMVRWDYYKELGYPEYANYSDLLKILKQMQDKHPTNELGQKVYGVAPLFEWGMTVVREDADRYFGKLALDSYMDVDTETYTAQSTLFNPTGSYWTVAKWYNEAYKMGLFDPDSFTMKYDNLIDKTKNGQILLSKWGWAGPSDANAQFRKNNELKGWEPLPPAKGETQYRGEYGSVGNFNSMLAISKNTKYPERAMQVINYLMSYEGSRTIMNGVEGNTWKEENGKPVLIDFEKRLNDPDFSKKSGAGKYYNWAGWTSGTIEPRFNIQLDYGLQTQYMKAGMSELDKDFVAHYNAEYPGDVVIKKVEAGEIKWNGTDYGDYVGVLSQVPEDIQRMDSKIDDYLKRTMPKIIMAKNENEFNKTQENMMKDLKELNAQKSIDYWTKIYDDNKKVVQDFKK